MYIASGSALITPHEQKILGAREQYLAWSTIFLWWEFSNTSYNFPTTMFLLVEKYMIVATRYVIMLPNTIGLVFDAVDLPCSVFINSGVN